MLESDVTVNESAPVTSMPLTVSSGRTSVPSSAVTTRSFPDTWMATVAAALTSHTLAGGSGPLPGTAAGSGGCRLTLVSALAPSDGGGAIASDAPADAALGPPTEPTPAPLDAGAPVRSIGGASAPPAPAASAPVAADAAVAVVIGLAAETPVTVMAPSLAPGAEAGVAVVVLVELEDVVSDVATPASSAIEGWAAVLASDGASEAIVGSLADPSELASAFGPLTLMTWVVTSPALVPDAVVDGVSVAVLDEPFVLDIELDELVTAGAVVTPPGEPFPDAAVEPAPLSDIDDGAMPFGPDDPGSLLVDTDGVTLLPAGSCGRG